MGKTLLPICSWKNLQQGLQLRLFTTFLYQTLFSVVYFLLSFKYIGRNFNVSYMS